MKPKNALIVLNELNKDKGIKISDFTINSNPDGCYTAIVTVNSNQYQKKAVSKMAAKKLACEAALRDYAIAKMKARPRKPKTNDEENQPSTNHVAESMDSDGSDNESEEDILKLNLASYAMYKLFRKWKRNGYFRPEKHSLAKAQPQQEGAKSAVSIVPKEQKNPRGRAELPPNWQTMHPASLLQIMRPGIKYLYYDKDVELQRLGVIVDNQKITAYGCSKKVARRNVAANACNILFGTNFTPGE
ncbi:GL27226 [Drosophila persimilis]|uniref:GL27226 n=2 Tax=Drosophila persimilis TaxID=7234 RepID=B4GYW4_DROPE|nr:GL27226 [Drosophila persimilis]